MLFKIANNVESRPSYDTIFQHLLKLDVFRIRMTQEKLGEAIIRLYCPK